MGESFRLENGIMVNEAGKDFESVSEWESCAVFSVHPEALCDHDFNAD